MRAFLTKPWVYRAFGVLTFFCTAAYLYLHQPWTAFWCGLVGLNSFTAAIQRETSDLKDMTISVLRERASRRGDHRRVRDRTTGEGRCCSAC